MLSHRTFCSPSTEMLCPWTEADAMIETVVVVELYIGPLLAFSKFNARLWANVALYNIAFDLSRLR